MHIIEGGCEEPPSESLVNLHLLFLNFCWGQVFFQVSGQSQVIRVSQWHTSQVSSPHVRALSLDQAQVLSLYPSASQYNRKDSDACYQLDLVASKTWE